jgi:hypothetical protein
MWRKHWDQFEKTRTEIFNMMMGSEKEAAKYTQQDAKRIMQ